jgi:acyl-CoA synthetase (AMP-forming)/AMP-acid ligase II
MNLGDLIDRAADPAKVALIEIGGPAPREVTYAELTDGADAVARTIDARGLRPGDRVGLLLQNRTEYLQALLGVLRAGLVAVPINYKLPAPAVAHIVDDARISLVFCDRDRRPLTPDGIAVLDCDADFAAALDQGPFEARAMAPQDLALILYTSGSSGQPKGVLITHGGQSWALSKLGRGPHADQQRAIVAAPLFHMNGLFSSLVGLFNHGSLVLLRTFDTRTYLEAISRYAVNVITAVPTMLARAAKEQDLIARLDLSCVLAVAMGSAPVTEALVAQVRAIFPAAMVFNSYGATEIGPAIFGPHPAGLARPPLSLGYPLEGGELKLVGGETDKEGVLMVRNPSVTLGYNNQPDSTAAVLQDGWYDTRDVMRRDADGFYYFVGRADDMFVCSGENIYPSEIEKTLSRHPSVDQVAIVPLADAERGQVPVAFVTLRSSEALSGAQLKEFALAHAPAYQHPRRVAILAELPLGATNKVDKKVLAAEAVRREATGEWSS